MNKTPDKIYIAESLIKKPYGNEWSPTEYVSRENTEYIRKDALLEWAKNELESITGNFELAEGGRITLGILIDKLNSI